VEGLLSSFPVAIYAIPEQGPARLAAVGGIHGNQRSLESISRILVGQRSPHFCPRCQPLPAEEPRTA
jgi:hypothetical protein